MSPKLITVYGATGAQGSSVLRSLSKNKQSAFTLRGTTRNPTSASSAALLSSIPDLSLVTADGWDKASMVAAFRGSWGAFVNTNSDDAVFDEAGETRTEVDLGKSVIDAAVEAGVKVLVYSGLRSAREITGGKVTNQAFEDKNAIGEYAKATGAFEAVIIASAGWYLENFLNQELAPIFGGFPFIPAEDGTFVLRVPKWGGAEDVPLLAMSSDFGDIVHGVFLDPERWNGNFVQCVSDIRSFDDAVAAFERVTGKKARSEEIQNWQDLETYGIRALETVKYMFGFCQESGGMYYGEKTENKTAQELKGKAVEACGQATENAQLLTLEDFFSREFGRD